MREICLDTETTGLDPRGGHKIIEIACIELINKVKTGNVFHTYVNPRRDVPYEAFKIHGISTEFLQDKPIFNHVAAGFLDFIKGGTLVIHNAEFDLKFLNFELGLCGLPLIEKVGVVDSLLVARAKFPGSPNSLDALCKRFGVDLSKRTKHGALLDTELLADVYIELMGGAQAGLGFETAKQIKAEDKNNDFVEVARKAIPSRGFTVSEDDLAVHQKFISTNFKSNLWGY